MNIIVDRWHEQLINVMRLRQWTKQWACRLVYYVLPDANYKPNYQ